MFKQQQFGKPYLNHLIFETRNGPNPNPDPIYLNILAHDNLIYISSKMEVVLWVAMRKVYEFHS